MGHPNANKEEWAMDTTVSTLLGWVAALVLVGAMLVAFVKLMFRNL